MLWGWSCGASGNLASRKKFRTQKLPNIISNTGMLFNYGMSALNVTEFSGQARKDRTRHSARTEANETVAFSVANDGLCEEWSSCPLL
jgi:hypothetical protein